jgi:hypothetical protein
MNVYLNTGHHTLQLADVSDRQLFRAVGHTQTSYMNQNESQEPPEP